MLFKLVLREGADSTKAADSTKEVGLTRITAVALTNKTKVDSIRIKVVLTKITVADLTNRTREDSTREEVLTQTLVDSTWEMEEASIRTIQVEDSLWEATQVEASIKVETKGDLTREDSTKEMDLTKVTIRVEDLLWEAIQVEASTKAVIWATGLCCNSKTKVGLANSREEASINKEDSINNKEEALTNKADSINSSKVGLTNNKEEGSTNNNIYKEG